MFLGAIEEYIYPKILVSGWAGMTDVPGRNLYYNAVYLVLTGSKPSSFIFIQFFFK